MVEYVDRNLNERLKIVEEKVDMILTFLNKTHKFDDIAEQLSAKPKGYNIQKHILGVDNGNKNKKP